MLDYLAQYERRYELPIQRPIRVKDIERAEDALELITDEGRFSARNVVSATGTWSKPYIPDILGRKIYSGTHVHSAFYVGPDDFAGQNVLVVGGGNSGAQIMAEIAPVARALWVTIRDPVFLPDNVDGRVLFERAVARMKAGPSETPIGGIGDIVMVSPVREARERGDLVSVRPFERMTETGVVWPDGSEMQIDAIIWCTGFRPALDHLSSIGVLEPDGRVTVQEGRALTEPRLWLAGYGDWTGAGSATLMGAARTAKGIAEAIACQGKSSS